MMNTNNTSFNTTHELSISDLNYFAPSAFGNGAQKSSRTSNKYHVVPTVEVAKGLMNEGWKMVRAHELKTRKVERQGFQKHIIHFQNAALPTVNGIIPELLLTNSYDGLSSYNLKLGLFRFVCCNGLVAGSTIEQVNVRHIGDQTEKVITGSFKMLEQAPALIEQVEVMSTTVLDQQEQLLLADISLKAVYGVDDITQSSKATVEAEQVLNARRFEDRKADVFTTYNTIQENVVRGGLYGRKANGNYARTRAIKGMDRLDKTNRLLWDMAAGMAAIKAGLMNVGDDVVDI